MNRFAEMLRSFRLDRIDYWLSNRFDRKPHHSDEAFATWTQLLGRDAAALWLADRQQNNA